MDKNDTAALLDKAADRLLAAGESELAGRLDDLAVSMQQVEPVAYVFGGGDYALQRGTCQGKQAIFIRKLSQPGIVGERLVLEDKGPEDRLLDGERVWLFPTAEQADCVLDALCNRVVQPARAQVPAGLKESLLFELQAIYDTDGWYVDEDGEGCNTPAISLNGAMCAVDEVFASASPEPAGTEIPLNDETRFILGRMVYHTVPIARRLRELGSDINTKAEDEQAAALHFLLNLYLAHGEKWREKMYSQLELPTHPAEG